MPGGSPLSSLPLTPTVAKVDGGDGSRGSPKDCLKKAANTKFLKTHPAAYTAFSKMPFSTQDIGYMTALVGIDKLSHEDAVKNWLAT